jgi:hypothetical protein
MATPDTMKRLVRARARALRGFLVPGYEDLLRAVAEADQRIADLQARLDDVSQRMVGLEDGLHEARRLNLRIAELTDVVTELVLPLHDRDIDPKKFEALAPDTL